MLHVLLPILLHLSQILFLSLMNQVPMEGSSSKGFAVPIHFDLRGEPNRHGGDTAFAGILESGVVNISPQGQMWLKRKCYQFASLLVGIMASGVLLLKLAGLRRWVATFGKPLHINENKVYFGTGRTITYAVTVFFVGVHVAMMTTDRSKMLTKELLMMTSIVALTATLYATILLSVVVPVAVPLAKSLIRTIGSRVVRHVEFIRVDNGNRIRWVWLLAVTIMIVVTFGAPVHFSTVDSFQTAVSPGGWPLSSAFFRTVTGEYFDICQEQQIGTFSPDIRYGIAWPQYLPRRLLNFFTGTELCGGAAEATYKKRVSAYLPIPASPTLAERRNLLDFDVEDVSDEEIEKSVAQISQSLGKSDQTMPVLHARRKYYPLPGRAFSEYDRGTKELLVTRMCPHTKTAPAIIVEDFRRNQMGHNFEEVFPDSLKREFRLFHQRWPNKSMKRYIRMGCSNLTWRAGMTPEREGSESTPCTIHWSVDASGSRTIERVTQNIQSYPVIPPYFATAHAIKSNIIDGNATLSERMLPVPSLPFEHIRIPLLSEGVSVFCDDDEEYHVHPVLDVVTGSSSVPDGGMPRNLLIMVIDAVSRQEVRRTLPHTASFLKWHHDQTIIEARAGKAKEKIRLPFVPVRELKGYTTIGHSTSMNLAPVLGGDVMNNHRSEAMDLSESNIFNQAKKVYGKSVFASVVSGTCGHTTDMIAGAPEKDVQNKLSEQSESFEGGFGGPLAFVDKDHFASMCHIDYGGLEGNFQGPYSIKRRCIGQKHVHDHVLEYTDDLLFTSLFSEKKTANVPQSLLHMSYFLEGHEGTHAVINLVDVSLYRFLRRLEIAFNFFSSEKNLMLIVSDHGNHMGPYFEWSALGAAERSTPIAMFLGAPISRTSEESEAISISSHSVSTPFDLHLTLSDVLGLGKRRLWKYPKSKSLLDKGWMGTSSIKKERKSCADAEAYETCILRHCQQ